MRWALVRAEKEQASHNESQSQGVQRHGVQILQPLSFIRAALLPLSQNPEQVFYALDRGVHAEAC